MSTRAIVAFTAGDGTWQGVWNHQGSSPQNLGAWIIRKIAVYEGDIPAFADRFIVRSNGWSSIQDNEPYPAEDAGNRFSGTCSGETLRITAVPDAQLFYLLDVPERALRVYTLAAGELEPFTSCTFDAGGRATPRRLDPMPE